MKSIKNFIFILFCFLFIISCVMTSDKKDGSKENFTERPVITNFDITGYGLDGKCYYVSESGNDSNEGLSTSKPFKTIQRAVDLASPGDIVFIMNGTYTNISNNDVAYISPANSGTENHWIMYTNYPGHSPKLEFNGWAGFNIQGADYIIINGFEIEGNNNNITYEYAMEQMDDYLNHPETNGVGISVMYYWSDKTQMSHHAIITNNKIYNCGANGIGTVNADYVTIENNVLHHNAFYSPLACSGISTWENWSSDSYTGYKMIIRNNISYCNFNYVPFYYSDPDPENRIITDGNGIIIDNTRNIQEHGQQLGDYNGKTLVQNNLVFFNGARGINVYQSKNVDVFDNTCFKNNQDPEIIKDINFGDISVVESININVYNNIIYTVAGQFANFTWDITNVNFDFNLIYNTASYTQTGSNDVFGDPVFISIPADYNNPLPYDFHLNTGSSAIDAGANLSTPDDLDYNPRPYGSGYDIGAYEYIN